MESPLIPVFSDIFSSSLHLSVWCSLYDFILEDSCLIILDSLLKDHIILNYMNKSLLRCVKYYTMNVSFVMPLFSVNLKFDKLVNKKLNRVGL